MRKRKGAALPIAIMLCSFLILISFGVAAVVIQTSAVNRANTISKNQEIAFLQSHEQYFHSSETNRLDSITDDTFNYIEMIKTDELAKDIRALVAKTKTTDKKLRFYAIYDFTSTPKVLVYQTSNLNLDNLSSFEEVE